MFSASKSGQIPSKPDPQFNYVTALLHGDGTNGAQNNTFLDSSSNNFTVTRSGSTTQGSFSPYGSLWSNYFGGSGNYLSSSSTTITLSGNLTFECWVNFSNVTTSNLIIFFSDSTTGSYQFGFSNGNLYFTTTYPYTVSQSSPTYVASTWSHIAAVRSGTTLSIYVNGTRVGTTTSASSFIFAGQHIGVYSQNTALYNPIGYISNLRITNTAVYDPTQTSLTVPTAPLTAITGTQLLTCQSNRFIDNSTNNLTISTGGTPSVQRFNPFLPTYSQAYSTSVYGGSGYFNGSTDYLTTPSTTDFNFGSNNFTVEFWWNTTKTGQNIINPNTGASWGLLVSGGSFYWNNAYNVTSLFNVSATSILNNAWHHVAFVRSSGTIYVYYDGVLQTSNADPTVYTSAASTWNIGNGNVDYFNGYLCDLRVNNGTAVYTSAFTPPTAPLTAITNTKLLLSYTNGAIYDNAMMNDLVTVGSAQISTSVKKYGTGSLSFNGTNSYLSAPSNTALAFGTGQFTVEFWINFNAVSNINEFFCFTNDTNAGRFTIYYNGGSLVIVATGGGGATSYSWTPSTGVWYHLAFSRDSSNNQRIFVDGVLQATATSTNNYSQNGLRIGFAPSGSAAYFNGYIDDARITSGYCRYTSTFTPPTTALPNYGS